MPVRVKNSTTEAGYDFGKKPVCVQAASDRAASGTGEGSMYSRKFCLELGKTAWIKRRKLNVLKHRATVANGFSSRALKLTEKLDTLTFQYSAKFIRPMT